MVSPYQHWHFISRIRAALWMVHKPHAEKVKHLLSHLLPAQAERMWGDGTSGRKKKRDQESLLYIGPGMSPWSFTRQCPHNQSGGFCVHVWGTNSKCPVQYLARRFQRLSVCGSLYYINRKRSHRIIRTWYTVMKDGSQQGIRFVWRNDRKTKKARVANTHSFVEFASISFSPRAKSCWKLTWGGRNRVRGLIGNARQYIIPISSQSL